MSAQELDFVLNIFKTGAHHYKLECLSVEYPYFGTGHHCGQRSRKLFTNSEPWKCCNSLSVLLSLSHGSLYDIV